MKPYCDSRRNPSYTAHGRPSMKIASGILRPIEPCDKRFARSDSLGPVAESRRKARCQQQDGYRSGDEQIPKLEPIAALKIRVGPGFLIRLPGCQIGLGRGAGIESGAGFRAGRYLQGRRRRAGLCVQGEGQPQQWQQRSHGIRNGIASAIG